MYEDEIVKPVVCNLTRVTNVVVPSRQQIRYMLYAFVCSIRYKWNKIGRLWNKNCTGEHLPLAVE